MRVPLLILIALGSLAANTSHAASPAVAAAPAARGAYRVILLSSVPGAAGEQVVRCRVRLDPGQGSALIAETHAPQSQGCAIEIPLTWARVRHPQQAVLGLEMELSSGAGQMRHIVSRQNVRVDYPPENGESTIQMSLNY